MNADQLLRPSSLLFPIITGYKEVGITSGETRGASAARPAIRPYNPYARRAPESGRCVLRGHAFRWRWESAPNGPLSDERDARASLQPSSTPEGAEERT